MLQRGVPGRFVAHGSSDRPVGNGLTQVQVTLGAQVRKQILGWVLDLHKASLRCPAHSLGHLVLGLQVGLFVLLVIESCHWFSEFGLNQIFWLAGILELVVLARGPLRASLGESTERRSVLWRFRLLKPSLFATCGVVSLLSFASLVFHGRQSLNWSLVSKIMIPARLLYWNLLNWHIVLALPGILLNSYHFTKPSWRLTLVQQTVIMLQTKVLAN